MSQAVRVLGVPKHMRRSFHRALALSGAGSQSVWLQSQIRKFIFEQQSKYGGDLFGVLTLQEKDILGIIASGAAELQHIAEESLLSEAQIQRILTNLVDCGYVEERKKGGKTEQARGAVIKLYFVTSKYEGEHA